MQGSRGAAESLFGDVLVAGGAGHDLDSIGCSTPAACDELDNLPQYLGLLDLWFT